MINSKFVDFLKGNSSIINWIVGALFVGILIFLFIIAYRFEKNKIQKNADRVKKMTAISALSAISVVLYYFIKFPLGSILPFIPGFLDIQFSSVPIFIGGYLFGPISGTIITMIRFLVKLPATTTVGVGEFADLLIGLSTVLVSSLMYHKNKTKKGAIQSTLSIIVVWTVMAVIANWIFILPFYMEFYGFDAVFSMLKVIPGVTEDNVMFRYLLISALPFNLILSSLVSLVTFVIYKRLSMIYAGISFESHRKDAKDEIKIDKKQ